MLQDLPTYISIVFGLTTLATLLLFHWVVLGSSLRAKANLISAGLIIWLILQATLSYKLFYFSNLDALPPRFLLAFVPIFFVMIFLFWNKQGQVFINSLSLQRYTILSVVRIPVEICLYWLAVQKTIPELMTFAGRNFDILAGITAPFVAYFGFRGGKINKSLLLTWNVVSLLLLIFIIINALLSGPTPLQQFAFEQPNIAVFHFPFVWLPAFIVPIVLFGHFVSIARLRK